MKRLLGIPYPWIAAFVILALLFIRFPQIDIWFSDLFWDPENRFFRFHTLPVLIIYHSVEVLSIILVGGLLTLSIVSWRKRRAVWGLTPRRWFYLLLVLALGPGLLVNLIAKNISGRARPNYIIEFGGNQTFTPAFMISDQCHTNCSFVSGHASFGFYFVALAMIMRRHRKKVFAAAVLYGLVVGLGRIMQGGHYLSDVIFAFFFVYFVARATFYLMFERHYAEPYAGR